MRETIDLLGDWRRSHLCGELRKGDAGKEVTLMGWVHRRRDHGGLIFVDLRDREGIVQVVFNPEVSEAAHRKAHRLRNEYVIAVKGKVAIRPEGTENPKIRTGEIEVMAEELKILNEARTPPFPIEEGTEIGEGVRLRYRYLDLRRPPMQQNLLLRHRAAQSIRRYLSEEGFLEIETPFLTRSTPEGARDFLVPSRLNPGAFYALPQSPQLFKQLLMVSGFDRYFQIVRCFRDEDLRADRQPEFTQVDMEMAFVGEEEVQGCVEGMIKALFEEVLGVELKTPFPRLTYEEALSCYGTDKPDLRFGMELVDVTEAARRTDFQVFLRAAEEGGVVKGMNLEGGEGLSRKELDELVRVACSLGAKGLAWAKVGEDGWQSPIAKFIPPERQKEMEGLLGASKGDLLLFVADEEKVVNEVLGEMRLQIAQKIQRIPQGEYRFVWEVDFPLLEWSETEGRLVAVHHPFTAPKEEDIGKLEASPLEVRARAYDLVLNGTEVGGGSIRNHRVDIQRRIFELLGIGEDEAEQKFGFLLEALSYGAPPHGGIALGFDRLVMLMSGRETIRDVIPFPKTQKATCLLTGAPSEVEPKQLKELHIKLDL
ncbi:MAG: aspartate--tRNA ligase [Deltaproteobacteria bacterium]|nr:MAG: aspartate--tRNA ligase [Deltaproteobacteria bacterium]